MKVLTAAEMREVDRLTIERGIPGVVLMHCQQARYAAAFLKLAAHQVAGALRGDHEHVDLRRSDDAFEVWPQHGSTAGLRCVRLKESLLS